jgi:hypothetical protein
MLRFLAALVLALPAVAQFPNQVAALYTPIRRAPVVHVYQLSRAQAGEYFRRVANGTAGGPSSASCRDLLQQTNWVGSHGMLAYTDAAPLTQITFEHCAIYDGNKDYENMSTLSDEFVEVTGQSVHFHSETAGARIADFDIALFDITIGRPHYDGTLDYQGPSGAHLVAEPLQSNALLVTVTVAVLDEDYFRAPWTLDTSAFLSEACFTQCHGSYSYEPHNLAAMACVAKWNR